MGRAATWHHESRRIDNVAGQSASADRSVRRRAFQALEAVHAGVWPGSRGCAVRSSAPCIFNELAFNLRFPGQYFDSETGLHHNYFRDYDGAIGRYIQSDPIGRLGGLNTYGYVRAMPLTRRDMFGLRDAPGESEDKPLLHPDYRPPDPMQAKCWVICKVKMQAVCSFPLQALGTLGGMGIGFFAGAAVGGPPGAGGGAMLGAELGNAGGFALCAYVTKKQCDAECPKDPPFQCIPR